MMVKKAPFLNLNQSSLAARIRRKKLEPVLLIFSAICLLFVLFIFAMATGTAASPDQKLPLKLIPELTIGQETEEYPTFAFIGYVDTDAKGNIYVLDTKYRQLKIFKKDGQLLRTIAIPQGQGPQELNQFSGLAVTPSGRIFINGDRKMILYEAEGNYLRTVSVNFHVSCIGSPGTEEIIGIGPYEGKILHVFNEEGQIISSFADVFDVPQEFQEMKMLTMFGAPLIFSCSKDGRLFVMNPHSYEILIFRNEKLEGKLKGKNEFYHPIIKKPTKTGLAFISTAAQVFPAGEYILVYLSTPEKKSIMADVFLKGKQIGSLELPGEPKAIDYEGKLYLIDQQEYPRLIRCAPKVETK